jgi:hypothetical protein
LDEAISAKKKREDEPVPPTFNDTLLAAEQLANGTLHKTYNQFTTLPSPFVVPSKNKRQTSDYWVPQVSGSGLPPMGSNPSYPV